MSVIDALKVLLLLVVTAVAYGGLRLFQIRTQASPELVRKLFHISGGIIGLALPWLFDDFAPVRVLGGVVTGALVALRIVPHCAAASAR